MVHSYIFLFLLISSIVLGFCLPPSPPLDVTQLRGHYAGSSPSPPRHVTRLHFYGEKIPAISYLIDSHQAVSLNNTRHARFFNFEDTF